MQETVPIKRYLLLALVLTFVMSVRGYTLPNTQLSFPIIVIAAAILSVHPFILLITPQGRPLMDALAAIWYPVGIVSGILAVLSNYLVALYDPFKILAAPSMLFTGASVFGLILVIIYSTLTWPIYFILAIRGWMLLGKRGYQLTFMEFGYLLFEAGEKTLKCLPPRDELLSLPGINNCSYVELSEFLRDGYVRARNDQ